MMLACLITTAGSAPLAVLSGSDIDTRYLVFPCAALQYIGVSVAIETSSIIIMDLVSSNGNQSVCVYQFYGFMDKLVTSLLLFLLILSCAKSPEALRLVLALVPSVCTILCAIVAAVGFRHYWT